MQARIGEPTTFSMRSKSFRETTVQGGAYTRKNVEYKDSNCNSLPLTINDYVCLLTYRKGYHYQMIIRFVNCISKREEIQQTKCHYSPILLGVTQIQRYLYIMSITKTPSRMPNHLFRKSSTTMTSWRRNFQKMEPPK